MENSRENDLQTRRICLLLLLGAATLIVKQTMNRPRRKHTLRRWWVRPINCRKRLQGDFYNLYREMRAEDPEYFFNYTRMSIKMFGELLDLVKPLLTKKSIRPSIPAECRLLITIRLLASGDCLQSIARAYRLGTSTVCNIFRETCVVIWKVLQPIYIPQMNEGGWKNIANDYQTRWNLPNCVGAIDGKHVIIKQPNYSGSMFFNYKKTFSVILFGVCDARSKFTAVDIGAYCSQSDGGVLKESNFGERLNNGSLGLPPDHPLPNTMEPFPYYFIGDDAFPLKDNLMKPYSGRNLQESERIYNYRISRARRCIENAFGILASRWRIFHKKIFAQPETVDEIIKACTCLHNYIISNQEHGQERYCNERFIDKEVNGVVIEGAWREAVTDAKALQPLHRRLGARNARRSAIEFRETLMNYVNNEGSVPWQRTYVNSY